MAILWEDLSEAEKTAIINENKPWWNWREICDWEYNLFCEESGNCKLPIKTI